MPGFHPGHAPGNEGLRYPADPPKVEEIIAVIRAGDDAHGRRLRGLIVIELGTSATDDQRSTTWPDPWAAASFAQMSGPTGSCEPSGRRRKC